MKLLEQKVGKIEDSEIKELFQELRRVTGVNPSHYEDFFVIQFLQQCLYPKGASEKVVKIEKAQIDQIDDFDSFILRKKVGKAGDNLYRLFRELLQNSPDSLDKYSGTAVYVFLNKVLGQKSKKSDRRYSW